MIDIWITELSNKTLSYCTTSILLTQFTLSHSRISSSFHRYGQHCKSNCIGENMEHRLELAFYCFSMTSQPRDVSITNSMREHNLLCNRDLLLDFNRRAFVIAHWRCCGRCWMNLFKREKRRNCFHCSFETFLNYSILFSFLRNVAFNPLKLRQSA